MDKNSPSFQSKLELKVSEYKKRAEGGDHVAQILLFSLFHGGGGHKQDELEAKKWCLLSAKSQNKVALAIQHFHGFDVKPNCKKAFIFLKTHLKKVSSKKKFASPFVCFLREKFFIILQRHEREDDLVAFSYCGTLYYLGAGVELNYTKALSYFEKASKKGDDDCRNMTAWMQFCGKGMEADRERAKEMLADVAKKGNASALFFLHKMFREWGDECAASRCLQEASSRSHVWAYSLMAGIAATRESKSGDIAIKALLEQGVHSNDDSHCWLGLGKMYLHSPQLRDPLQAKHCFERAAQSGNCEAFNELANLYLDSSLKDLEKAKEYFSRASETGNAVAMYSLAWLYREEQRYAEAISLLEESSNRGFPKAYFSLACMYFYGEGVSINFDRAKRYYLLFKSSCTDSTHYGLMLVELED